MSCIEVLGKDHLAAIIDLHHLVLDGVPADLAARETDVFFEDHLARCGRIFGVFEGKHLRAYAVLGLPGPGDANFGVDHHLSKAQCRVVAHIDGIAVHPAWRGQGWQRRLIAHRIAQARLHHREIMLSTAAPGNFASVFSLLSEGLQIRSIVEKFGGMRYLMRRDVPAGQATGSVAPVDVGGSKVVQWCPIADIEQQKELLEQGFVGTAYARRDGEVMIGYDTRPTKEMRPA